jgi:hypothetical protein
MIRFLKQYRVADARGISNSKCREEIHTTSRPIHFGPEEIYSLQE